MNHEWTKISMVLAAALLVACGGNDAPVNNSATPTVEAPTQQAQYEALLAQANEALAEARIHAQTGPCSSSEQCSTLSFRSPQAPCFDTIWLDYSTGSADAALAEAAASRYAAAATAAEALAAPPNQLYGSCSTLVDLRPLACIENRCQRGGFVLEGPPASGL